MIDISFYRATSGDCKYAINTSTFVVNLEMCYIERPE